MKVCFVSSEVFHWGVHGGFGYLTWMLGKKLVEYGIDVSVVTQRREGQGEEEWLDGFKVYGYPSHKAGLGSLWARRESMKYYRKADADIYHSQAISYNTYVAHVACPEKKHVLTFQDPYDREEWKRIAQVEPRYGSMTHQLRIEAEIRFLADTCRKLDALYSQAHFLVPKAARAVPNNNIEKAEKPTVCFLARWDPQKRVEIFFKLAESYPEIDFIAMGKSHDPEKDRRLRETYSHLPNLSLTGFVSESEKHDQL